MKSKDTLQLEALYEQITDVSFIVLDEENDYFEKASEHIANLIKVKQSNLETFASFKNFRRMRTLSNFDPMLWTDSLPWFFDKDNLTSQQRDINEVYKSVIQSTMVYIDTHISTDKSLLILFIDRSNNKVVETVDVTNKQELKKAIKSALLRTLIKWVKSEQTEEVWLEWRKKQIQLQTLKDKLPELKGIF